MTCFISFCVLVGCGDTSSSQPEATHHPTVVAELPSIARILVPCNKEEADRVLVVTFTFTATPDWPGYTIEFPLRHSNSMSDDEWNWNGDAGFIGDNGFHGKVHVNNSTDENISLDVSLAINLASRADVYTLDKVVELPLDEDGDRAMADHWSVKWLWAPAELSRRTK